MIDSSRFLVSSSDYDAWLAVRASGVTATAVAKAVTPEGFREVVDQIRNPTPIPDNDYMRFGREQEGFLIEKLATQFELEPNEWLISKDADHLKWQMATPDGLSPIMTSLPRLKPQAETGVSGARFPATTTARSSGSSMSRVLKLVCSGGCFVRSETAKWCLVGQAPSSSLSREMKSSSSA